MSVWNSIEHSVPVLVHSICGGSHGLKGEARISIFHIHFSLSLYFDFCPVVGKTVRERERTERNILLEIVPFPHILQAILFI